MMDPRRWAALYSLVVGTGMIGMWRMFYAAGDIPELETRPLAIGLHLLAEGLTAVLLIAAALGLFSGRRWAEPLYFVSTGMLVYTMVQSPGYFLQQGDYGFGLGFLGLIIGGVGLLLRVAGDASRRPRC